jgi:protein gp37
LCPRMHCLWNPGVEAREAEERSVREIHSPIDWVIVGGESGNGARPMHIHWVRSLRDECQEAGVAFHFKQWGAWLPVATPRLNYKGERLVMDSQGNRKSATWNDVMNARGDVWGFEMHGKKATGRLLDGRTWDEFPEHQKQGA